MTTDTGEQSLPEFAEPIDILLIDDDEAWARGTARLLEHTVEAFRVETAASLGEGRDRYFESVPDCVVCDYQLGDGTGLELLETVREDDPDCPFILVTGRGDEHVASEATRKGITEYIVKHDDDAADQLTNRIANVVSSARTERALERQRRSKNAILELLTAAADEMALCEEFCSLLVETHGYECVWIGTERYGRSVVVQASAGTDTFLDDVVHEDRSERTVGDPALAALDADESVVWSAADPAADDETNRWQTLTAEFGFETAAGVPIRHEGVRFGVLGVYATECPKIDDQQRRLFEEFADALGYALQTAEVKRSLLSDRPVTVRVEIPDTSIPLVALEQSLPGESTLTVPSTIPRDENELLCLVNVDASDSVLRERVETTDRVRFRDGDDPVRDLDGDGLQCGLVVTGQTPETLLANHGANVVQTVVESATMQVTARLSNHDAIATLEESLESTYTSAIITSIRQDRRAESFTSTGDLLGSLTDKQENAIRHAYYQGFFEHPRDTTATQLAEQFGVTRQTVTHHLRAAERKLLDRVFD